MPNLVLCRLGAQAVVTETDAAAVCAALLLQVLLTWRLRCMPAVVLQTGPSAKQQHVGPPSLSVLAA